MLESLSSAYKGRKVIVTGHTGFKGSWLITWLEALGAEVVGFSLDPPSTPNLYDALKGSISHEDVRADIRDAQALRDLVRRVQPDYVFHLAAQALVRQSYKDPLTTFSTNVQGTANVLSSLEEAKNPVRMVVVTTDKCYKNQEWVYGYRETDPLGGDDPYSASKGAAEIVANSWAKSFLRNSPHRMTTARAGNVIGGGDYADDRLIPDCVRAIESGQPVMIRNPSARRPWQHVLEPLGAYLLLGSRLDEIDPSEDIGWNIGPREEDHWNVGQVATKFFDSFGKGEWKLDGDGTHPKETTMLSLNCDKTRRVLGWAPLWTLNEALSQTAEWYRSAQAKKESASLCRKQIDEYLSADRQSSEER